MSPNLLKDATDMKPTIWVSYYYDPSAIISGIFDTEIEALRFAITRTGDYVKEVFIGDLDLASQLVR